LSFAAKVASILSEHRDEVYTRSPQESCPILKPAAAFLFVQLGENSFNLEHPSLASCEKEENAAFIMNGVYSFQFKLQGRLFVVTFACIQVKTLDLIIIYDLLSEFSS